MLDSKIHFLITFCKNQCLLRSTGPVDRNTMTAMVFQNPVNTRKVNVGEMLPETMNILTDFYEPFNEQLAELLGDRHYLYHLFWFQNKFQKIFSAIWRTNFVSNNYYKLFVVCYQDLFTYNHSLSLTSIFVKSI